MIRKIERGTHVPMSFGHDVIILLICRTNSVAVLPRRTKSCTSMLEEKIDRTDIVQIGITSSEENYVICSLVAWSHQLPKEKDSKYKSHLRPRNREVSLKGNLRGDIATQSRTDFVAIILSDQQALQKCVPQLFGIFFSWHTRCKQT